MNSIRLRLLIFVLVTLALIWSAIAIAVYQRSEREVEAILDAELAQSAQVLLAMTMHEIEEAAGNIVDLEHTLDNNRYATKLAFQVWTHDHLMLRSDNAPRERLSSHDGYGTETIDGVLWRVYVMKDPEGVYSIQVGHHQQIRKKLIREMVQISTLPLMVALPLMAMVFWASITRGMRPLQRMTREVARRSADDMSPIIDDNAPVEVKPLTRALNNLLQRLNNTFERERSFTADASHELRTPLASIKTQAQVAQRATDEQERQQALKQIGAGVDRATHLVEQLLTLARLDPIYAQIEFKPVNLCRVLEESIATLAPAAYAKNIDIGMTECQISSISGNEAALSVLMCNLLDNAIRYTPDGGIIDAAVMHEQNRVVLTVTDSGPGIPEAERTRVLDRFYRGKTAHKVSGSGLGLSIVQRIAELHGATLMLDEPESGQGLRVTVTFRSLAA